MYSFLLDVHLDTYLLSHRVCICLSFVDVASFPKCLYQIAQPSAIYENCSGSLSLPTLVFCLVFLAILVDVCFIVILICDLLMISEVELICGSLVAS